MSTPEEKKRFGRGLASVGSIPRSSPLKRGEQSLEEETVECPYKVEPADVLGLTRCAEGIVNRIVSNLRRDETLGEAWDLLLTSHKYDLMENWVRIAVSEMEDAGLYVE